MVQKIVTFVIILIIAYVAYQAKWFDAPVAYFKDLAAHSPTKEVVYDEYGNATTVEYKSIMQRLKDLKK